MPMKKIRMETRIYLLLLNLWYSVSTCLAKNARYLKSRFDCHHYDRSCTSEVDNLWTFFQIFPLARHGLDQSGQKTGGNSHLDNITSSITVSPLQHQRSASIPETRQNPWCKLCKLQLFLGSGYIKIINPKKS